MRSQEAKPSGKRDVRGAGAVAKGHAGQKKGYQDKKGTLMYTATKLQGIKRPKGIPGWRLGKEINRVDIKVKKPLSNNAPYSTKENIVWVELDGKNYTQATFTKAWPEIMKLLFNQGIIKRMARG